MFDNYLLSSHVRKIMKGYIVLILLLAGCTQVETSVVSEFGNSIELYFCPREDCESSLIGIIHSAKKSVHCALYDVDLKTLIAELENMKVDVKIIMEKDNFENQIKVDIVLDDDKQLMHNKFCVIDGEIVATGSFNPTENGNFKNHNNLIIIPSKYLAQNYEDEFNELWKEKFGIGVSSKYQIINYNNQVIENYFCPEDDCGENLIHEILNAKKSIYFMSFSFTDEKIADALLFSKVSVKGIVDKKQLTNRFSQIPRLIDFGIEIGATDATMHHKVFVIDEEIVITGSYNPTWSGDNRNDENILIIRSNKIAERYLEEFEYLYTI